MKKESLQGAYMLFITAVLLSLAFDASAQIVNIPDANFKTALVADVNINTNLDAEIQVSEATAFAGAIDVNTLGISDMTGIEAFPGITSLRCYSNAISTGLDVSYAVNLVELLAYGNQLTSIDVSYNTALQFLNLGDNQLTSIDLTQNTELLTLNLDNNQLSSIDLSQNAVLENLNIFVTPLTTLDVSNNPNLVFFNCPFNQLTSIDFSNNLLLSTVNIYSNALTSLDVSMLSNLAVLRCDFNNLSSLNLQNGANPTLTLFNATDNPGLSCVQVDNVAYMNTSWSNAISSPTGYSTNCSCVISIPDTNFIAALVADLTINTNGDGVIQCSEASAYTGAINVSNLAIASLTGIESFTAIDTLICTDNALTSLDVTSNTQLVYLCFSNNQLTTIDLSSNTLLVELCGQFNQLTAIDVSANTALKYLYVSVNQLTSIDVSSNTLLWYLSFANNTISTIDVLNNPELFELNCSYNQITSLDLSANNDMYYLYCDNNMISSLDLSSDTSLVIINCNNNQLTALNIQNGNNLDLTAFNATGNPLLTCVKVDDVSFMNTNWAAALDGTAFYSVNCITCAGLPSPQFTISNNSLTTSPAFTLFSNTTANLTSYNFLWNFGDGCSLNNNNSIVNYTYNTNGSFNVSLTLNDPVSGCSSTNYDPAIPSQTVECNVPFVNPCSFTPTISPSGAIDACMGSSVELALNPGSFPATAIIQWNKNGVPLIGENYSHYSVTTDGFYSVTVFDINGCPIVSDLAHVQFNQPANTPPGITATGTTGNCGTTSLTLTANGSFGSFLWNTGQAGNSINVTQAGVYYVTGMGAAGCNYTSAAYAVSSSVFTAPEICMVDVDSLTNRAVIVWTKPLLSGIMAFGIYKETALYSNNYQQIAVVPYDSLSEYMDINSNAAVITERYRISIIDSCGGETPYSEPARAMGLKVYPGINSQRVLTWNHYASSTQNSSAYLIYSGASINQLSFLDSVAPGIYNNYIDDAPVAGINTVYKIYTVMNAPCTSTRAVRNISQSNGTGNLEIPFVVDSLASLNNIQVQDAPDFRIVPNPNNGVFNVKINSLENKAEVIFIVYDMLGNSISQHQANKTGSAEIDLSKLNNGIYTVKAMVGNSALYKRLIITK